MIKDVYITLCSIIVIKVISLITELVGEPYMERRGYTGKEISRALMTIEVLEILITILVLKAIVVK